LQPFDKGRLRLGKIHHPAFLKLRKRFPAALFARTTVFAAPAQHSHTRRANDRREIFGSVSTVAAIRCTVCALNHWPKIHTSPVWHRTLPGLGVSMCQVASAHPGIVMVCRHSPPKCIRHAP